VFTAAPRILVADADVQARAHYRQAFAPAGCDVVEAPDGREALTKALLEPPALVVTEIDLPFVDGYALSEILRRDRATACVPILVVTSDPNPFVIHRARTAGADAVLIKPATPEQLLAELQRLFAHVQEMHAAAVRTAVAPFRPSEQRRVPRSKTFPRFSTTTPPAPPPPLVCPSCDGALTYEQSYVGGVSERYPEQWDHYTCPASCGAFQYRQRTRKLCRVD
jgi:two-component system chemotaxis response regulator CheY